MMETAAAKSVGLSVCGDGIIQPVFEVCDDGFVDACGTCNADCSAPGSGYALLAGGASVNYCGDGELCPEYEICDDGNVLTTTRV